APLDVVHVDVAVRAAARHTAAMVVAAQHLAAECRRDRRLRAGDRRAIEVADVVAVAQRALDRGWRHLDGDAAAVLPAALALLAHGDRDLVRGATPRRALAGGPIAMRAVHSRAALGCLGARPRIERPIVGSAWLADAGFSDNRAARTAFTDQPAAF